MDKIKVAKELVKIAKDLTDNSKMAASMSLSELHKQIFRIVGTAGLDDDTSEYLRSVKEAKQVCNEFLKANK